VETRPASLVAGDLVLGGVRLDGEGFLAIPDAPGLGVRWNWPHIERLGRG
jgi:L-alanine-DL-glutamate epimerase-like enolase superfamily enzyme